MIYCCLAGWHGTDTRGGGDAVTPWLTCHCPPSPASHNAGGGAWGAEDSLLTWAEQVCFAEELPQNCICWDKSWIRLEGLLYGCFWPKLGCIIIPLLCGTGVSPGSSWRLRERTDCNQGSARKMALKTQVSGRNFLRECNKSVPPCPKTD